MIRETILTTEIDVSNPNMAVQLEQSQYVAPEQNSEFSTKLISFHIMNNSIKRRVMSINHEFALSCLKGPKNTFCISILSQKKAFSPPITLSGTKSAESALPNAENGKK